MSSRLADLISAAMVECEKEMEAAMAGREATDIPRNWFAYHAMQRSLTPLMHQAEEAARRAENSQPQPQRKERSERD